MHPSGTSCELQCCIAVIRLYIVCRARGSHLGVTKLSIMSQQLQISSLFSAFALVCLCLFARVGGDSELRFGSGEGPIVQVLTQAE